MVLSGTNMKPSPMPCRMPVRISVHSETSGVKPVISHSTAAVSSRPDASSTRGSTRLIRRPTIIMATMVPTPRGARTRPAVTTG